ncbi:MAG TPA: hypothetical protein VIK72_07905 [Clostridiaceae bacterium]
MKKKIFLLGIMMILGLLTLTGCVPGDGTYTPTSPAGFFWGIWHGWMAPISLILGLSRKNIRIYEVINTGWLYDLGFYIAVISGFGGLSLFRRNNSKKE